MEIKIDKGFGIIKFGTGKQIVQLSNFDCTLYKHLVKVEKIHKKDLMLDDVIVGVDDIEVFDGKLFRENQGYFGLSFIFKTFMEKVENEEIYVNNIQSFVIIVLSNDFDWVRPRKLNTTEIYRYTFDNLLNLVARYKLQEQTGQI